MSSRDPRDDTDVTASEVASYVFCAKAWHLERVLQCAPSRWAAQRRAEGITNHGAHGAALVRAKRVRGRLVRLTAALIAIAVILALVAVTLLRR